MSVFSLHFYFNFLRSCYLVQCGIDYCLRGEAAVVLVPSSLPVLQTSTAEQKLVLMYGNSLNVFFFPL